MHTKTVSRRRRWILRWYAVKELRGWEAAETTFLMKSTTVGTIIIRIGFLRNYPSPQTPPPQNQHSSCDDAANDVMSEGGGRNRERCDCRRDERCIFAETDGCGPVCELIKVVDINNSSREINF